MDVARRVATRVLRVRAVNHLLRVLAGARGRRLVLVYHRVGPRAASGREIIPSVPRELFRAQLQLLGEVAEFMPLDRCLDWNKRSATQNRRPAIAVTFDDDLPSHAAEALPVLVEMGIPAAFFLSGRVLRGTGPYWFQQFDALLATHGEERTASLLGWSSLRATSELVREFEQNAVVRRRIDELAAVVPNCAVLDRDGLRRLAAAGMTIGFHTLDHHLLPAMNDAELQDAVVRGRSELAAATGAPVEYFAYPYGETDSRSAAAVRGAGFRAAFTGRPLALRRGDDCYCLGRWEPGPIGVDDLLAKLAVRLHRVATPGVNGRP